MYYAVKMMQEQRLQSQFEDPHSYILLGDELPTD